MPEATTDKRRETMQRVSRALREFVGVSSLDIAAGFGFDLGIAITCTHPEWAQSVFLQLYPSEGERESARAAFVRLIEMLPMATEQEAQ